MRSHTLISNTGNKATEDAALPTDCFSRAFDIIIARRLHSGTEYAMLVCPTAPTLAVASHW